MITAIRLLNFQGHRKKTLPLGRVSSIVGPSDAGKSSFVRALFWLVFNRPRGDAFIRDGEDQVTVEIDVDDHRVGRRKGKQNLYRLDDEKYKAVGTGVPDPICDLLRLSLENFQQQHDAAFWFTLTPAQISKELNGIVNLDHLDRVLSSASGESRKLKTKRDVIQERVQSRHERLQQLAWVEAAESDLQRIASLKRGGSALTARLDRLGTMIDKLKALESTRESLSSWTSEALRSMSVLEQLWERGVSLEDKGSMLSDHIESMREKLDERDRTDQRTDQLRQRIDKLTAGKCPVCQQDLSGEVIVDD